MNSYPSPTPAAFPLRYEQATAAQQAQALEYLQTQLLRHFPDFHPTTWASALAEFQPELLLTGEQVTLSPEALTQLVQYLADLPEFVPPDPPVYGQAARHLAQCQLYWAELAVWALPELEAAPATCGPRVYALIQGLAQGHSLAEKVVQAFAWGPRVGRPLPPGLPGGGPAPGSATVQQRLQALAEIRRHCPAFGQPPNSPAPGTATSGTPPPGPTSPAEAPTTGNSPAAMATQRVAPASNLLAPVGLGS